MSKNKFAWTLALILIALISLPIAYAQEAARPSWFYVLVNTLIIGIVLFMLQAFLVPGKEGKEKTAIWFIVLIASLLIAWFYGSAGFIWQGPLGVFLRIKVLVNALIIAAALYFLLGLLKVKTESPQGKTGYGLLLFIIALVFAVRLGNQWIWDAATIRTLVIFFFGPQGILTLNQNRLFIFIGTAVLFSWFFITIGVGKESRAINYMLAIVLAARLATGPSPLSAGGFKLIAMVIGTWVLGGNLAGNFTTWKGKLFGYVMAFALVSLVIGTIETAVSPERRAEAAGRGIFGLIGSIFGFIFSKWILLILIIAALLWVILRGENKELVKEIKERYGRIIWNRLKQSADSGILRWVPFIRSNWHKRQTPKDMLHQIFLENLYIFHALTNYMKRLFIFFSKWGQVRDGGDETAKAMRGMGIHTNEPMLIEEIKAYRAGGEVANRDPKTGAITGKEKIENGWFGANKEMMELVNEIGEFIGRYLRLSLKHGLFSAEPKPGTDPLWYPLAKEADSLKNRLTALSGKIKSYSHETMERLSAYGHHNVVKAWRYLCLDQTNPSGRKWPHPDYKFILPGTELVDANGRPAGKTTELTEVNMFGEVLEDIYKNIEQFGNPLTSYTGPRKVKDPRNIMYYPKPHEMFTFLDQEWEGYVRDLRYGEYHPYSRSFIDYQTKMVKKKEFYDDSKITASLPSKKDSGNPAFDREALKNPGQMIYWGRTRYYDKHADIEPKNPYPALSNFGITQYLRELVLKDMEDVQEAISTMNRFLGDTGEWVTEVKEAKKAIGLLGELGELKR